MRKKFKNWILNFFSNPNGYWVASEREVEKYLPSETEIRAWWGDTPEEWGKKWKEIADWFMVGY